MREIVRSVRQNLRANKARGVLTMLGIIIGVGAVVFVLAVGNGLLGYVDDTVGQYGGNNITIQPARLSSVGVDTGGLAATLSLADAEALAEPGAVPDAVAVSPTLLSRGLVTARGANFAANLVGAWPDYLTAGGYGLSGGAFITDDDVANGSPVVVLGATVAHALFGDTDPIGATVWIRGVPLRVVGQMESIESLVAGGDASVYLPLSTMLTRVAASRPSTTDGTRALDAIVLRARATAAMDAMQREAVALLMDRHRIDGGQPDFVVSRLVTAIQERAKILTAITSFMGAVAVVSLLVGGSGS